MLKKQKLGLAFLSSLVFLPHQASASLIGGWGVYVNSQVVGDCGSNSCSLNSDFLPNVIAGNESGGQHQTSGSASGYTDFGESRAYADLDGFGFLPTLRVYASSEFGENSIARAFAVQHYTYQGSDDHTIDLNFNLHGVVNPSVIDTTNHLKATVAVLTGSSDRFLRWEPWTPYDAVGYLYEELGGNFERAGIERADIFSGEQDVPGSLSFNIDSGESFYVLTEITASTFAGTADGWNTLSLNFADTSGLTAASGGPLNNQPTTAVPLPATWLMLLLPLAMLVRRKN